MKLYDPSEDPEPTHLWPLRFRLGTLFAHTYRELQVEDPRGVTRENYDRRFLEARKKAIDAFAERF